MNLRRRPIGIEPATKRAVLPPSTLETSTPLLAHTKPCCGLGDENMLLAHHALGLPQSQLHHARVHAVARRKRLAAADGFTESKATPRFSALDTILCLITRISPSCSRNPPSASASTTRSATESPAKNIANSAHRNSAQLTRCSIAPRRLVSVGVTPPLPRHPDLRSPKAPRAQQALCAGFAFTLHQQFQLVRVVDIQPDARPSPE